MARLTPGEEMLSLEHEFVHRNLDSLVKSTYIKVTAPNGATFFCAPADLANKTVGLKGAKTESVQMTQVEFEATQPKSQA